MSIVYVLILVSISLTLKDGSVLNNLVLAKSSQCGLEGDANINVRWDEVEVRYFEECPIRLVMMTIAMVVEMVKAVAAVVTTKAGMDW